MTRHPCTRTWTFPPEGARGGERVNLRELVARPERFEHHLLVVARLGVAQLEVVTASEPLYFAHVNISDEYAVALPTGDALLDHFPLRTFVSDPESGEDLARYNHHSSDLVLHPVGFAHWPGRLRPPYEGLQIPPGMRRCGLSLVYCASAPTGSNAKPVALDPKRAGDVKPYRDPAPALSLADLRGPAGVVASIGTTSLELVVEPASIAPPHGGFVVVLEGDAPGDLIRVGAGDRLDGRGITRALVLSGDTPPDPAPPAWRELPASPFAAYEDAPPGTLPVELGKLHVAEDSATRVAVSIGDVTAVVPRYWLARMLFRVALHGFRLGYVETYEGLYVDDSHRDVRIGIRTAGRRVFCELARDQALAAIEQLYRAIAPPGYRERLE
ncbi:MAG: hypothetical protein ABI867_20080 [Kofleriaceae bacterium]